MLLINRDGNYHFQTADALYLEDAISYFMAQEVERKHQSKTYLTGGSLVGTLVGGIGTGVLTNYIDAPALLPLTAGLSVGAFISLVSYISHENAKQKEVDLRTEEMLATISNYARKIGSEPILIGYDKGLDFITIPDACLPLKKFTLTEEGYVLPQGPVSQVLDLRLDVLASESPNKFTDLEKLQMLLLESLFTDALTDTQVDILEDIKSRTIVRGRA